MNFARSKTKLLISIYHFRSRSQRRRQRSRSSSARRQRRAPEPPILSKPAADVLVLHKTPPSPPKLSAHPPKDEEIDELAELERRVLEAKKVLEVMVKEKIKEKSTSRHRRSSTSSERSRKKRHSKKRSKKSRRDASDSSRNSSN
jgi:hypothetical protein